MRDVDSALVSIYRAAREKGCDQFQQATLDILRHYVPFDSARWASASSTASGVVFHSVHLENEPDSWSDAYAQIRAKDRAADHVLKHPRTTGNFHFPTFFDTRADAEMRDYTHRYRHEAALITCHRDAATGLFFTISLFGADENRPYSERERQLTQTLYPHLMEAWAVNHALHMERVRKPDATRSWSIAVCTDAGYITLAEPAFLHLLRDEWPTSASSDALPRPLADSLKSGANGHNGQRCVFRYERRTSVAFVRGRPLQPLDRLSGRELAVVRHLSVGLTHKEIARAMGIAPATVRNHVQAIHNRIGVRTNAELVAQMKECEP